MNPVGPATAPGIERLESRSDVVVSPDVTAQPRVRSLWERVAVAWQRRETILRFTVAVLLVSTAIVLLLPKRYEATTRLMPPDQNSASSMAMVAALSRGEGLGAYASELLGLRTSGALFVGILRSRTLQERIVTRFDLKKVYSARLNDDARRGLAARTLINDDRKTGIITITVSDKDPKRAALIAAAYIEELNRLVAELSTSSARRERIFLEQRLAAVKNDLDETSQQLAQFSNQTAAIDIKEQGRAMIEAAATLQGQLIAAESELKGLQQIYTDNNVRVRLVQARIEELRRELNKLGGKKAGRVPPASAAKVSENRQAAAADSDSYPSIRDLPVLGLTWMDLYRKTKISEAVYETLTKQYELAKVQEAKEIPTVKVLDPPEVPEWKSGPHRFWILLTVAFLTPLAACAFIVAQECFADWDPQDPRKVLLLDMARTTRAEVLRHWQRPGVQRIIAGLPRIRIQRNGTGDSSQS